jgi:fucose 4-O-acetylase-like acetyltransferase
MGLPYSRVAYFDNLKGFLIVLVVIGHAIEPLIDKSFGLKSVYVFIYAFHMPLFIFVAGYFSNLEKPLNGWLVKLVTLLIISELLYRALFLLLFQKPFWSNPFTPTWIVWFLASLISWRLLLWIFKPSVSALKYWIAASVLLGLFGGIIKDIGYPMSLSRTMVFAPFFLSGYYSRVKKIEFPILNHDRLGFILILLGGLIISALIADRIDVRWLYGSFAYSILGTGWIMGIGARGLIYLAAVALGFSFAFLTGNSKNPITSCGRRSLHIYLLHGVFVKTAVAMGCYSYIITKYSGFIPR